MSLPSHRFAFVVALGIAMFAGTGCEPTGITRDWRRIEPPAAAEPFTLKALDGLPVTLIALKGRVVVMEFWATWCTPCRFSLPSLEEIGKRYRDRGVSVLLINVGEAPDQIRAWAEGRYTSPILIDEGGKVAGRYGIEAIPRLFIVDQAGRLVWAHQGYGGGLEHNLTLILEELLGKPSSTI